MNDLRNYVDAEGSTLWCCINAACGNIGQTTSTPSGGTITCDASPSSSSGKGRRLLGTSASGERKPEKEEMDEEDHAEVDQLFQKNQEKDALELLAESTHSKSRAEVGWDCG